MNDLSQPQRRFGVADKGALASLPGLEFLRRILDGTLPAAPICQTLDFDVVEVEPGRVVFAGVP
ncbi:MAG TPA: hypothetical protein VE690_13810, partial [Rhodopila sp.]|nr:hypothetical protein [Rhodopila sp.]